MANLDVSDLKRCLSYDGATGQFVRLSTATFNPKVRSGSAAGCKAPNGYVSIRLGQKRYMAHRLAWFYVFGQWPEGDIDHINGDPSDNRISNLRPATRSQNMANTVTPKNSTSGVKGVSWDAINGRWLAQMQVNGKVKNLGRYDSLEEAAAVRRAAFESQFGRYATHDDVRSQLA